MRQQTKPFIIECKPSPKTKPDAAKPSVWGKLDGDIAQGLQQQLDGDQRDTDHATATGSDDRA